MTADLRALIAKWRQEAAVATEAAMLCDALAYEACADQLEAALAVEGEPARGEDELNTDDYRNAPSGIGPQAPEWKNKPHRLIYDLCREVQGAREAQENTMMDDVPRRCRLDKCTPAELAIYDAMQAVEAMPADVRLTDAVVLLQQAREKVADYVDAQGTIPPAQESKARLTDQEEGQ